MSPLTAPPITTSLAWRAPFEAACFGHQNPAGAVQVADQVTIEAEVPVHSDLALEYGAFTPTKEVMIWCEAFFFREGS
jgi:hypothetical protein